MAHTRNIFTSPISVFANALDKQSHRIVTLGNWLADTSDNDAVADIRELHRKAAQAAECGDTDRCRHYLELYKYEKAHRLSCAMPTGVCPDRKQFFEYSDILQIDIDAPKPGEPDNGNGWVSGWCDIKREFAKLPIVAYAALSVGGNGIFILIPIDTHDANEYGSYFDFFCDGIAKHYKLQCDKSCRNLNRLRFTTFDPEPVINTNAEVFAMRKEPQRAQPLRIYGVQHRPDGECRLSADDKQVISSIVEYIEQHGIDITADYSTWFKVLAFFVHNWDDAEGRNLCHRISAVNSKYSQSETDYKLSRAISVHPNPIGIGTFFYICKQYGVPTPGGRRKAMAAYRVPRAAAPKSAPTPPPPPSREPRRLEPQPPEYPKVPTDSQRIDPEPVPQMSASERQRLAELRPEIGTALAAVDAMRSSLKEIDRLCNTFKLRLVRYDDLELTDAQSIVANTHKEYFKRYAKG